MFQKLKEAVNFSVADLKLPEMRSLWVFLALVILLFASDYFFASLNWAVKISVVLIIVLLMMSCTKPKPTDPLVQKGRTVYQAKCIVCHNADPKLAGALGPEVKGASLELLNLRIKEGIYPQN